MPIFESDGAIDLTITPKEFYKACRIAEQTAMCDIIMDDFDLIWDDDVKDGKLKPRSNGQMKFNDALVDLGESWYSISKVDEEIIMEIAKKYELP